MEPLEANKEHIIPQLDKVKQGEHVPFWRSFRTL